MRAPIALFAAALALAACAEAPPPPSVREATGALVRAWATVDTATFCSANGQRDLRKAVRDYTAAVDRDERAFPRLRDSSRSNPDRIALQALIAGQVQLADFQGEPRRSAKTLQSMAAGHPFVAEWRRIVRSDCEGAHVLQRSASSAVMARERTAHRLARAAARGDSDRVAQLQERLARRERRLAAVDDRFAARYGDTLALLAALER